MVVMAQCFIDILMKHWEMLPHSYNGGFVIGQVHAGFLLSLVPHFLSEVPQSLCKLVSGLSTFHFFRYVQTCLKIKCKLELLLCKDSKHDGTPKLTSSSNTIALGEIHYESGPGVFPHILLPLHGGGGDFFLKIYFF